MTAARLLKSFLSTVFLLSVVFAASAFADEDDPPSQVARVSYLKGNVSFQPSGEDEFSQASINYPLTTGDRIYTDEGGRAELETGNLVVRISGSTDITTTSLTDHLMQFGVSQGTARFRAYSLPPDQSIEIDTPNAAFTILRPGNYRVETYPDSDTTLVSVISGDLEVSGADDSHTLHGGEAMRLTGENPARVEWVSLPDSDDFDRWCRDRDRRFDSSHSSQYVSRGVPGYEDLDDYGRWEPVPQYGQVWYPTAVAVDWVPYRYGHWAWVEPWGWTWIEDEPWGFAPFHYGRWVFIGSRWGWVPAPPVAPVPCYAPALVAFVGGGGFSVSVRVGGGVQAWFPLGPDEPFYPWYHHSPVYLRQVNVTNVRNVTVVNNIINVRNVNVTNVTYVNQRVATTAVPTQVFRTSQPVARQVVAVRTDEIASARVIEHPQVRPDVRAITAGAIQTHPPVQVARPMMVQRTTFNQNVQTNQGNQHVMNQNNVHTGQGNDRVIERGTQLPPRTPTPVTPTPGQPAQVIDTTKAQHNNPGQPTVIDSRLPHNNPGQPPVTDSTKFQHNNPGQPPTVNTGNPHVPVNTRVLVTKTPPPPPPPPFEVRRDAMQSHPGRPLEPQQVRNIEQGKPAGPMQDREYHPHDDNNKGKAQDQHSKEHDKQR